MYVCMYVHKYGHINTHIFINDQANNKTPMFMLKFVFLSKIQVDFFIYNFF